MKVNMNKLFVMIPLVAMLVACGSAPRDPYERLVKEQRERQEREVERAVDRAPKWMTAVPVSANAVYAVGTAVSGDFSMADYKAKMFAYGKICVAAGGTVSQQGRIYMQDTADATYETSELAIRTLCPAVDVTGVEVKEIKRVTEGTRYRTYVLVALPTGDANALQQRRDRMRLQSRAQNRADAAFKELDEITKSNR